jgi:hypothetical protein
MNLGYLFLENFEEVEAKCDVTEEDVLNAFEVGRRIARTMNSSFAADVTDEQDVFDLAWVYLRRGIEEIRACARFAFRHDPKSFTRYPVLSTAFKKRPSSNGTQQQEEQAPEETSNDEVQEATTEPETQEQPQQPQHTPMLN